MPFVDFDGAKVHYETEGSGKNITLLHGITASLKYWCFQTEVLSKKFRVIQIDHRGHGLSDGMMPKRVFTIQELAASAGSVLSALKVEKTILMGHSLGGITALQYALDNPDKIGALILADTASGIGSMTRGQKLAWRLAGAMRAAKYAHRFARKFALKKFALGSEASGWVLDWFLDESDTVNWAAAAKIARGLRKFDVSDRLGEIKCPTLIVCGEEDRLTPLRMSEFMHGRIKGSELKVIKGAGHCASAEKPEEFNRLMMGFLEKV